jgi:hypothetical protein
LEKKFTVTRSGRPFGEVCLAQDGLMTEISYSGASPDGENVYRLAAVCGGRYVPLGVPAPSGGAGGARFEINDLSASREVFAAMPFDTSGRRGKPCGIEPFYVIKKRFTKNALRELGFAEPSAFELVLPGEEYTPEECAAGECVPEECVPEGGGADAPETAEPEPVTLPEPEPTTPTEPDPKPPPAPPRPLTGEWAPEPEPGRFFPGGGEAAFTEKARGALARADGDAIHIAVPISGDAPFPAMPVFCLGEPETIGGEDYLVFKLKNGALIP